MCTIQNHPISIFFWLSVFIKINGIQKNIEVHLMCPDLEFEQLGQLEMNTHTVRTEPSLVGSGALTLRVSRGFLQSQSLSGTVWEGQ